MSKVDQIMEGISSLVNGSLESETKLEFLILMASQQENKLVFSTNLDAPEISMLLYNLCKRSEEFKLAIKAVNAQIEEDIDRKLQTFLHSKHLS